MPGKNPPFILMNLQRNDIMHDICFKNYFSQKIRHKTGKRLINVEAR